MGQPDGRPATRQTIPSCCRRRECLSGSGGRARTTLSPSRYNADLSQPIVGDVGGGKFTNAIAPFLFGSGLDDQADVVVDPEGEIAQAAGPFFHRAFAAKQNVFVLDPWNEAGTGSTATLNFLSLIAATTPTTWTTQEIENRDYCSLARYAYERSRAWTCKRAGRSFSSPRPTMSKCRSCCACPGSRPRRPGSATNHRAVRALSLAIRRLWLCRHGRPRWAGRCP